MQLMTSQPHFSKTVLRHLHRISWSGHSMCGVLATALDVWVRVHGGGVWESACSGRFPRWATHTGSFTTHGHTGWRRPELLPTSPSVSFCSQVIIASIFHVFIQQIFIAQVSWARNFVRHWRNMNRNVPWKHRDQFYLRRQLHYT